MNQRSAIRIGVIADTHGRFDPVVRRHFKGADYIFHAGDIGKRSVIFCMKAGSSQRTDERF